MSVDRALILRAQPHMLRQRISDALQAEITKGCAAYISAEPVPVEPPYAPLGSPVRAMSTGPSRQAVEFAWEPQKLRRFRIWISPEERFEWNRSEMWLKQLATVTHRVVFQIVGNQSAIEVDLVCHADDAPLVAVAFEAQFGQCEITAAESDLLGALDPNAWICTQFYDFYPPPPYSHNLTTYDELHISPFGSLLTAIRNVNRSAMAFYQCAFEPVRPDHDWHENVAVLLDIEYVVKLHSSPAGALRTMQQAPSGDLRQMARDVEVKAHNDKPFFAVAVRVGLVGGQPEEEALLRVLASAMNVIQHGGRPLQYVSHRDYAVRLLPDRIREMIQCGQTYRSGFIANSKELAGLVHVFPAAILEPRDIPVEILPSLPLRGEKLAVGTRIGICRYAGQDVWVCIPPPIRELSTHVAGSHGTGKSTLLANMFLQDIESNGAMYMESHGDAIRDILSRIKPGFRDRTIYFNPGDPEWIPLWNPMRLPPGGDPYRLADDVVSIFKRVSQDWGDRLEHVTRYACIGLQHLPNPCIMDIYNLLRQKTPESDQLRERILAVVQDEPVKKFFQTDYLKDYTKSDLQAPKHKLSKLVSAGSVSLMLSQPESLIDFGQIMDEGMILLVDLSDLGAEVREILGSFILTSFFMAALGRSKTKRENRRPYSIFVDEAHLYVSSDAIENLIAQARKFRISLCLAHQYLKQFQTAKIDALSTVGCTIIGRMDKNDSHFFANALQGKVEPEEIMALEPYEMIARIGAEIVRVKTVELPKSPDGYDGRDIVEESRRRFCRRAAEVRQMIARRSTRLIEPFAALDSGKAGFSAEELYFDEW